MKKIISVMLSVLMILSLCAAVLTVSAEDGYVPVDTYSAALAVASLRLGPSSDRILNAGAYFNAASEFNKISIPRYWSSNPSSSGRGDITIRFEVFEYNTDYDTSITGTALYTKEFTVAKDQNAPLEFDLGKNFAKGSYAISFSCVSEDDGLIRYFVLPETNCVYSDLRIGFSQLTFAFTVNFVEDTSLDSYFARLPGTEGKEEIENIVLNSSQDAGARKVNDDPMGVRFTIPEGRELVSVVGLTSPTWTESENNDMKVEIYAWNTDYDTTVSGKVLASAEVVGDADNADSLFALNNRVPSGDVLAVFSATNSGSVGFYGAASSGLITEVYASGNQIEFYPKMAVNYLVLEEPATVPVTEPVTDPVTQPVTQPDTEPVTDPATEPATEPVDPPQTGDTTVAFFAAAAVLAMAAAAVAMKKKVF